MLQRAASNAYSWWYASHVRTKQSKWLEQSLQDMGEKVENVLQLIQEDGDSFAKRAEMYYKKRPELINFVEESYRAYRSLAERYDHISRELQNANNTLASAFPDQYQFMMDDDDEYNNALGVRKKFQDRPSNNPNIPQTPPKFPSKNIKAIIALTTNSKKSHQKTGPKSGAHANKVAKSGLTLSEATTEIDKLQKQILTLQTEKEFAKSSYESGYAKYCDIDEQITGTQEKISKLQDEFEVAQVIEDDEARTLMAEAAIKSCNDTLSQLQEKQEKASEETKAESHKIKNVRDKLNSFKGEFRRQKSNASEDQISSVAEGAGGSGKSEDLELLQDKIKEHFDVSETKSLSVLEMAEKIDELVNKVINLESSMSFQTSLIHSLRSETDELQSQVKSLEDDKANLIAGKSTLNDKLEEMENKLKGLQDLNDSLENQNTSLETHFNEAQSNLEIITTKWLDVKQEEVEFEDQIESKENKESIGNMDVKVRIPQNEQVNDMITSSLSQDGEKVQKTILPMSIEEPPIPSKTNNIQQHESKLGIIDNNHQQETSNKKDEEMMNPQPMHKQQPATHVSTPPEVDVKFGIMQDEQVSDMIAPSCAQDEGDIVHKIILPMSTYEPTIPSKINSIQEQQSKQSTEDSNQLQETSNKKEGKVTNPQKTHKQQHATQANFTLEVESRELINMSLAKSNAPLSMQEPEEKRKEEPDWQELFTDCLEGKEKVLLEEYTTTLRNYKETKKKLYEVETKNKENFSEIEKQIKDLKISLATKDEEIHSLHQQLIFVHKKLEEHENGKEKGVEYAVTYEGPSFSLEEDDDIKVMVLGDGQEISPVEYKLRAKMDQILDENLDFWMRFSASFGQVQKFQNGVQDLQAELGKLEKKEGSSHEDTHMNLSLKSDVRSIYKHLIEIQTELTVWLEQSEKLKEELQRRFSQLCHIQEEIKHAVNAGAEDDDMKFTSFQAAKFQGEVANMQQENNKVADELQAGMDYINSLQLEVECTTTRLNEELGFYHSKSQNERSGNRARVPLRSFIFGVKSQKKKQSIFSRMHPGMTNRKYHQLKGDKSP